MVLIPKRKGIFLPGEGGRAVYNPLQFKESNIRDVLWVTGELRLPTGTDKFRASTATFHPDADPETSSVDGYIYTYDTDGVTWATITAGITNGFASSGSASYSGFRISSDSNTDKWDYLYRGIISFDTRGLPDDAVIVSATLSLHGGAGKKDELSITPNINIYAVTLTDDTDIELSQASMETIWDSFGSTAYCDTSITYANWDDTGWNDFTLNASGLAAISATGNIRFGVRNVNYDVDAQAPSWSWGASDDDSHIYFWTADWSAALAPKLTVVYVSVEEAAGTAWAEGDSYHFLDENGVERTGLSTANVDDTPVNGAITDPVSSNWAFDHEADTSTHGVTGTILGTEDVDDTPVDAATDVPPSSNWAYGHKTAHALAVHGDTPGARVYPSAGQTISDDTHTALAWNSETYDTDTIHDNSTNNSRLTCKTAGKYIIVGCVHWDSDADGGRNVYVYLNGTTNLGGSTHPAADAVGWEPIHQASVIYSLSINDYVELMVQHTAGNNLDVQSSSWFAMQRIG